MYETNNSSMKDTRALSKNYKVIALVSTGHFVSHFYMLLIPPLFPLLRTEFGVGYTELGLAIAAFSLVTGLTQAPIGFLVDRIGARKILLAGLTVESLAFIFIGLWPSYAMLVAMMALAGLANAVYHPADYAILNASVGGERMGKAFSIHTASGMLGNAVAPGTMVLLIYLADWQSALIICGLFGLAVTLFIAVNASLLRDATLNDPEAAPPSAQDGLKLLFSLPVLLGALFFLGIAIVGYGVSTFGISTLTLIHNISVADAATILSAYLFASPVGVLCGGWIADRIHNHHIFAASCFVLLSIIFFFLAGVNLHLVTITALLICAGFFSGVISPSRDMLIRSLAPPTEMGKVFGFVSTGFNIAGVVAPPLFGYILDHHSPHSVFWCVGVVSLLTVLTVFTTGQKRPQPETSKNHTTTG